MLNIRSLIFLVLLCYITSIHNISCNLLLLYTCSDQTFFPNINQKNVFNFVYSKPFHTKFRDSQSYFGFPCQLSKQFEKVHKVLARLVSTEQS